MSVLQGNTFCVVLCMHDVNASREHILCSILYVQIILIENEQTDVYTNSVRKTFKTHAHMLANLCAHSKPSPERTQYWRSSWRTPPVLHELRQFVENWRCSPRQHTCQERHLLLHCDDGRHFQHFHSQAHDSEPYDAGIEA